jgi:hypothetical protein
MQPVPTWLDDALHRRSCGPSPADNEGDFDPAAVLMGQSSLQVFCTHFVFCFIGIAMMGDAQRLYGWKQAALLLTTFATLYLVARLRERHLEPSPAGAVRKERRPVRPVVTS